MVLMSSGSSLFAAAPGEVTVIQSDERSLVFEYRPLFRTSLIAPGEAQEFTLYDFDESVTTHNENTIGSPDIRYRVFPVGFQSVEGNAVQVIAADYEDVPGVDLAPVPTYRSSEEMLVMDRYLKDPQAYGSGSFLPANIIELGTIDQVRSLFIGGVKVYPSQYNSSARVLRKYSRIVVEVVFASSSLPRVRNNDDELLGPTLVNYNIARDWKFGGSKPASGTVVPSVLSSGEWYRLAVQEDGVYRLDTQYLSAIGMNVASIDPRSIKVYGNGGQMLPEAVAAPRPDDLVENAIYVEGESDGQFNGGDFVLFYGQGTRGWNYVPNERLHKHYTNIYSDVNYYWLTFGGAPGKRMQAQQSLPDSPTIVAEKFTDLVLIEEEKVNFIASGKNWYGQSINPGSSFTHVSMLHGIIPGDTIRYRCALVARALIPSNQTTSFVVRESGNQIGALAIPGVSTSPFASQYAYAGLVDVRVTPAISGITSQLSFTYSSLTTSATGWIDWVEIHYPRRFEAVNNYLRFRSSGIEGIIEYRLSQFSSMPVFLNVTDPQNVRYITGAVGSSTIRMPETNGNISEYCAVGPGAYKSPLRADRMPNQNLRGFVEGADFIIVTSREFRGAATRLAAHREQPAYGDLRTRVVEVDSIYNEFGGGLPDLTAVRDFLKYAYDNWTRTPQYVLFLGGASYDYKGISGAKSSYVPTWQSSESLNDINSYAKDDYFVTFSAGDAPWLVSGRISSRTVAEAGAVVDKVIGYDTRSTKDGWGARMLFIGDDSWTPEQEDGTLHSNDAEILAENFTPQEFEKKKIYIAEYPTVNTAQGRRKPGAYQDIIDEINRGVLAVNFAGHGNPTVWTHEAIFSVQTSIPQLTNSNKLSVFYAATCNFSQFDDLRRYTGSEILMNKPDGGAIAVVSATRKVFAGANAALHQQIFARTFTRDQFNRLRVDRPARGMFLKKVTSNNSNDQKFFFMGDPTMRFQFPAGYAAIDTINTEPVDSVDGSPRIDPIQLKALSRVTVRGTVRDVDNRIDETFAGTATLTLNDATRRVTIPGFYNWSYSATGSTVYRGQSSVANGRFAATFIVPKDILYADPASRGRMVAYFNGSNQDGLGYTSKVYIGGTDTSAAADNQGPQIALYVDSRGFRSGDLVTEEPTLIVDLFDSSGINTSGSGIGHRIEAWLNNSAESRDITEFYTSSIDNYQAGTVEYSLRGVPQGKNTLRVRAWDTYNNASMSETFFEVTSSDRLTVTEVMNYPNPFARGTAFTFKQNLLVPINITVKIYTLAGRLIQSLESASPGEPFVSLPWDGRDRDGDELANGAYLYKVVVKTADGRFTSESLGKMAVVK